MTPTATDPSGRSYNATIAAIVLAAAAFLTLLLTHVSVPLTPLRLLVLVLAAFAAWSFGEEMGLYKPLNRAGFVFFAIAIATKVQILLGVAAEFAGRYHLLYAVFGLWGYVAAWFLWRGHIRFSPRLR